LSSLDCGQERYGLAAMFRREAASSISARRGAYPGAQQQWRNQGTPVSEHGLYSAGSGLARLAGILEKVEYTGRQIAHLYV
jgi:hypothetical protein